MHLAHNSFNYTVLSAQGFNSLSSLVQQTDSFRLEYADIDQALREISQLC